MVALTLLLMAATRFNSLGVEAGFARVKLTPPMEMKATLGGYGERLNRPATGVHDDVWAKALVFSNKDRKFALVTADVLGFPVGFKTAVLERLKGEQWTDAQVLLLPSHSHTSIEMMALHPGNTFSNVQIGLFHKGLFELTANRLATLIKAAAGGHTPIKVSSSLTSVADRNRNRREGNTFHDQNLAVTRIDRGNGEPLAVLVNWTAHPTFMGAEDMLFSGDWPGHLQRTLESLIGQRVGVMYYNGAEGDQSPTPPPDCPSHWERAERYGQDLAMTAWHAWQKQVPISVTHFDFRTETITLPKRQWHPDFMKTGGAEYGLSEANMQAFLEQLSPTQTHSTCFRLNDLLIVGIPGELASRLGMNLKEEAGKISGANCPTIGGLADEWVSYMLAPDEYGKGGYEASMSFYGSTLGPTILEGALKNVRALRSQ